MSGSMPADEIDYGPLAALIGAWAGDKGIDIAPEPDGQEENPYYETLVFEPLGDLSNAESQQLAIVRYQQIVRRKSNDEVFHDETGYWLWDASAGVVMHTLTIPRAVCVIAGGHFTASENQNGTITLEVAAKLGDPDWGIIQSPFMRDNASTLEFRQRLIIEGDQLAYAETTVVDIYGRRFDHTDQNELTRSSA